MNRFQVEPFRPAIGLGNAHVQTVLATRWPAGRGLAFERVRIDTPDGDFIDLDLPRPASTCRPARRRLLNPRLLNPRRVRV